MKNDLIYSLFNTDPFHTHMKLLSLIQPGLTVLEIGCATGYFTRKLIEKECNVVALEKDSEAYKIAKKIKGAKVLYCDVNHINKMIDEEEKFDLILLADILEHLENPIETLISLKKYLKKGGKFLISIPNIANFSIRLSLLLGKFEYQDFGILDKTHLRLFTKTTFEELLQKAGLYIVYFDVVSGFEVSKFYSKTIGRIIFRIPILRYLEYYLTKLFPSSLALEFIYEAKI